jgi:translation elongation factor P/translation initiation factor 5A
MEIIEKVKESKNKLNNDYKLSSLVIDTRKKEIIINFHNNKEKLVKSLTYKDDKVSEEDIKDNFKELKEEDEIKEEEIKNLAKFLEENKHYIVTKEKGELFLVEMNFNTQEIKKFKINKDNKELKESLKFQDIFKLNF